MATTEFTLDDSMIGQSIGPPDAWLTYLGRTQAGPYEMPQWSEGKRQWLTGRLVLQGSGDHKPMLCLDTQNGGGWGSGFADVANVVNDGSISYRGDLQVICVPKGSVWRVVLSDVENPRQPMPPEHNFSGSNYKPTVPPATPKASSDKSRGAKAGVRRSKAVLEAARQVPAE